MAKRAVAGEHKTNGWATYEMAGGAKHATLRARITDTRVITSIRSFERQTGDVVSRPRLTPHTIRLVSYQFDGGPVVLMKTEEPT